jgi:UDP-3-O-[3-hydroxymyristoyl] glucosamine N-acyltransferase
VIGSDGFGYHKNESNQYVKIPQIGNVVVEDDVEIGSNVSIDRAAMGSTIIKKGTKLDNLIQIAHNVIIGENTAISAQSGISGSTKIGNNCILAGQVGVADHTEICDNVILMAQSGVARNVTKPGFYLGSPIKEHRTALKLEAHIRNLPEYVEKIKNLESEIKTLKEKIENL